MQVQETVGTRFSVVIDSMDSIKLYLMPLGLKMYPYIRTRATISQKMLFFILTYLSFL